MADYVAGISNGFLRGHEASTNLFIECVMPLLRRSSAGEIFAYGVREVPANERTRNSLKKKFNQLRICAGHRESATDFPFWVFAIAVI
ncbi:MAG: hypothetical protein ACYS6K_24580 [Planctomycetota bacterium]|jgi:hypothetical protein